MKSETFELLTEVEAAEFLRISKLSLWRLRKRGEIPFVRLTKKLLYRRADLVAFVASKTHNSEVLK